MLDSMIMRIFFEKETDASEQNDSRTDYLAQDLFGWSNLFERPIKGLIPSAC